MTTHIAHPSPNERREFLVDDCPRCYEYVEDNGIHFDPSQFRAFWRKMIEVEFNDIGGYESKADKELGTRLYQVTLSLQRAFDLDPHRVMPSGF